MVKNLPANPRDTRDVGLIPGLKRSFGEGNGNPLQYSCLENSMDTMPGGLQSVGSQRHDLATNTHKVCYFSPVFLCFSDLKKKLWGVNL